MNRNYTNPLIVIVFVGALFFGGCAQTVDHSIAGAIKNQLPKAIGQAANYTVTVNTDALSAVKGKLHEVDIVGTAVNLSPQLLVDHLQVQAHDIDVNTSTQKVNSIGHVDFEAAIGQDSIDHYLATQTINPGQQEQDLTVRLNDSSVTASVKVKQFGLWLPVSVTGSFQLRGETKHIFFEPEKGSLSIIPIPGFLLKLAMQKINPVIDLTNSVVPVNLTSVTIQSGQLELAGTADLNQTLSAGT